MPADLYKRYIVYDDDNNNVGLTVGAWIGVVVAVLVVKILIIVAICYACKRRDRARRQEKLANPIYHTPGYTPYAAPQGPPPVYNNTGYNGGYYPPQESGKLQPYQHELQTRSAESFEAMPLKEAGRPDN